jgi:hypothetical protein
LHERAEHLCRIVTRYGPRWFDCRVTGDGSSGGAGYVYRVEVQVTTADDNLLPLGAEG